ncbi:MAG: endonuclease/exonuclease/phosphatase family protein [Candidatus Nanopelagicales bacterium]|nr:endonuclease/exonuclease/phosphatase family protein [Candidatus Nanopelagicales bacterium]
MSDTGTAAVRAEPRGSFSVVFSTVVAADSIRVLVPLVYELREDAGTVTAALAALAVFLGPFVAAPIRRAVGPRGARVLVAVLLAASTVGMQFVHPIPVWLAAGATVFSLVLLTLLLHGYRSGGSERGRAFALAVVIGLAVDSTLQALTGTWGTQWQSGLPADPVTVALAAVLLASIPSALSTLGGPGEGCETRILDVLPTLALGPFLMLQLSFAENIAFVDAVGGLSLVGGTAVVLGGQLVAACLIIWNVIENRVAFRLAAGLILVALAWPLTEASGLGATVAIICTSALLGPLLASSLAAGAEPRQRGAWRTSVAVGIGSLLFMLLAFLYQIDITNPLPIPRVALPVAAAVIVALCAMPGSRAAVSLRKSWIVIPVALLVAAPLVVWGTSSRPAAVEGNGRSLRILDWNVHSAVGEGGMLDPAAIADVIEQQHADVVVLQEVTRGWLIAGATDEAEWLSRRLGMSYAWSQAADSQFGNLLLSRFPIVDSEAVPFPYVDGPQHRSFVKADIDIGAGTTVTVFGAHLESNTARTHKAQVETMLSDAGNQPRTIIAGDMNMQPDDQDVALFTAAGFHSAQDSTGNESMSSALHPNFPGDRPDWIFGVSDVAFSDFVIARSSASDHLPVAATATVPPG